MRDTANEILKVKQDGTSRRDSDLLDDTNTGVSSLL